MRPAQRMEFVILSTVKIPIPDRRASDRADISDCSLMIAGV